MPLSQRRSFVHRLSLALAALVLIPQAAVHAETAPQPAATAQQAPRPSTRVDVNTASEVELEALPRIGPSTAKRILEYRKQVGTIKSVDELLNVKGIGERTLEFLKPLVTVGTQPAGPGAGKKP